MQEDGSVWTTEAKAILRVKWRTVRGKKELKNGVKRSFSPSCRLKAMPCILTGKPQRKGNFTGNRPAVR